MTIENSKREKQENRNNLFEIYFWTFEDTKKQRRVVEEQVAAETDRHRKVSFIGLAKAKLIS